MVLPWPELILFMAAVLPLALYGLTASGHFPVEFRSDDFKRGAGAAIMWGTMAAAIIASVMTVLFAWESLPWYAALIGGGLILLLAPLLLQPLPDRFVNGRASLVTFSAAAVFAAIVMWMVI